MDTNNDTLFLDDTIDTDNDEFKYYSNIFTNSDELTYSSMDIEELRARLKTLLFQYQKAINDMNLPKNKKKNVIVCSTTNNVIIIKNLNDNKDFETMKTTNSKFYSVSSNYDGTITFCTTFNVLAIKNQYNLNTKFLPKVCCNINIIKAMLTPDGSIVGIGMDKNIYEKTYAYDSKPWGGPVNIKGQTVLDIAVCPDNSLLCVGTDNQLYRYENYKKLRTNRIKEKFNETGFKIIAITVSEDGEVYVIDTTNKIKKNTSYKQLTNNWIPIIDSYVYKINSIALYSDLYKIYEIQKLEYINRNLMSINLQIQKLMKNETNYLYEDGNQNQDNLKTNLTNLYDNLLEDKTRIKLALNEYKTLEEKENVSLKQIKKYNTIITFFTIIFIILFVFIVITYFTSNTNNNQGYNEGNNQR